MENNLIFSNSPDLRNEGLRKPTLAQVGILYSIGVILLLYIGFRVQRSSLYPGLLITEFILVLLPPVILLAIFKYDIRKVLRLNRVSLLSLLIILFIMVFSIPVVSVFNLVNLMLIKQVFGKIILPNIPASENLQQLLINLLIIGGSAGICEEIMFRGTIQRGFERFGAAKSIIMTAFLFGLFHLDFQRFLGTFMLGGIIGFIVYRTNSLFGGMFAHFANNSIAVIVSYGTNKLGSIMKEQGLGKSANQLDADAYFATLMNMPKAQLIAAIVVWTFIIAFCISVLAGLMIAFIRTTSDKAEVIPARNIRTGKAGILWFLPGLLLIALMYIAIGFNMRGIENDLAHFIIRIIGVG